MGKIKFVNPEVDAAYEAIGEKDILKVFPGHNGVLSKVNMKVAAAMVAVGDPHIKAKEAAAPAKEKKAVTT